MHTEVNQIFRSIYDHRKTANPGLNFKTFAGQLGIDASTISRVFGDKKILTKKTIRKILKSFNTNDNFENSARERIIRLLDHSTLRPIKTPAKSYNEITPEQQKHLSEWYYFAIMNLAGTANFNSSVMEVADRIGIAPALVDQCVEQLISIGLLQRNGESFSLPNENLEWVRNIPNEINRITQKQLIDKAKAALDEVPQAARDISFLCTATNPANLTVAKKHCFEFLQSMDGILSKGPCSDVYVVNVQMFPITKAQS